MSHDAIQDIREHLGSVHRRLGTLEANIRLVSPDRGRRHSLSPPMLRLNPVGPATPHNNTTTTENKNSHGASSGDDVVEVVNIYQVPPPLSACSSSSSSLSLHEFRQLSETERKSFLATQLTQNERMRQKIAHAQGRLEQLQRKRELVVEQRAVLHARVAIVRCQRSSSQKTLLKSHSDEAHSSSND